MEGKGGNGERKRVSTIEQKIVKIRTKMNEQN